MGNQTKTDSKTGRQREMPTLTQSPNPNPIETPPTQTPSSQVLFVVGQHITQVLELFLKDVCGYVLFSQRSLISVLGRTVGKHTYFNCCDYSWNSHRFHILLNINTQQDIATSFDKIFPMEHKH